MNATLQLPSEPPDARVLEAPRSGLVRRATRELVAVPGIGARLAVRGASRLAGGLVDGIVDGLGDEAHDRLIRLGAGRLLRRHGTPEPVLDPSPEGYPSHRVATKALPDGTAVRLRPIMPDDAVELRAALHRLSERTRWLRFHAPISDLSDEQVRHLATVDHHDREAIVAEVPHGRHWQPIGVARYERLDDVTAELAIVLEDAYQGMGLGGLLLDHLITAARDEGIERLTGEVLAENQAVMALLRTRGQRFDVEREGTVLHTTTWLVPPPAEDAEPEVEVSRLKKAGSRILELSDVAHLRDLQLEDDDPGED